MIVGNLKIVWQYVGNYSTCLIMENLPFAENPAVYAKYSIKKYAKDQSNKSVARRKTLTGACLLLPKAERYPIWEQFRLSKKTPLWARKCQPKPSRLIKA